LNLPPSPLEEGKLLRNVFTAMGEGVIVIDLNHNIIEANPAALKLFRRRREELVGRKCYEATHGRSEPCTKCIITETLEKGGVNGVIHEHIRSAGEIWTAEVSATPLRDKRGEVIGVVEINRDVTIQKIASMQHAVIARIGELSLKGVEMDALMQEAVELVARAIGAEFCEIMWSFDGKLRVAADVGWDVPSDRDKLSAELEPLAGYTLKVRKPVVVRDYETDKRFDVPRLLEEKGITSGIGVPMIYGDKVYGTMMVHSKQKRKFSSADVDFLQAVANTITAAVERQRAELILEESQKKMREFFNELESILQTVPAAVLTTNGDGLINFLNRRAIEYLGMSDKGIVGTRIGEYFREKHVEAMVQKLMRTGGKGPVTLEATLRSGKTVQLSLSAMRSENGEVEGLVASFVDITPLKEAQQKMERAYGELQEINKLKSNIIANVSHELRTPITIARGLIEFALIEDNEEERRNELLKAISALDRLDEIVENLLEISKIQQEHFTLRRKRINLAEMVSLAIREKQSKAMQKNVKINMELNYNGDVEGDPVKLMRAILNILDNAIKFNRDGGKTQVRVMKENGEVKIAITDTGIGIPEERFEEIFQPLTQLDPSPTRRYNGIGMGLAVAKQIIEAHGGRIEVESEPGKGSTFCISLPLKE
jgi:PAS domain S-box-containing protein